MFPKRGVAALAITTMALVLLLSFKTPEQSGVAASGAGVAIVEPATSASPTQAPTTTSTGPTAAATPTPTAPTAASATIDGTAVSTRYGTIQVEIVVAGGQLQDVVALQLPTGRRSGQISNAAAPILRDEALSAKGASIDTVSGATYTSDAYRRSLQAALDQAGLG